MEERPENPNQGHECTDRDKPNPVQSERPALHPTTRRALLVERAVECSRCGARPTRGTTLFAYQDAGESTSGVANVDALTLACEACSTDGGSKSSSQLGGIDRLSEEGGSLTEWLKTNGSSKPLFATDEELVVEVKEDVREDDIECLKRSRKVDELLRREIKKIIDDYKGANNTYEGLVYVIFVRADGNIVPLYVGSSGKYNDDRTALNENMTTAPSKMARLGYSDYRHIGWLSRLVLGQSEDVEVPPRYNRWVNEIFEGSRRLKEPVFLWTTAWEHDQSGLASEEASLEELEEELIGITSNLYPDRLLNIQGAHF